MTELALTEEWYNDLELEAAKDFVLLIALRMQPFNHGTNNCLYIFTNSADFCFIPRFKI